MSVPGRSWVPVEDESPWGIQTLAYGVGALPGGARVVVRIGDLGLDVAAVARALAPELVPLLDAPVLNPLLAAGPATWRRVRASVTAWLSDETLRSRVEPHLVSLAGLGLRLPFEVADYVDFYASEHHASNLGRLFRPDNPDPLMPNWKHLPVGYHGRAASVVVSGTDIVRPSGQRKGPQDPVPVFGPSTRLDIEAELGFVVGTGNAMGDSICAEDAERHIFGVVLFNDWSARDIQAWEYVPLGPNLGKSFASTISPWVVPLLALDAARVPVPPQEPAVLPYLRMARPWGLDVDLTVAWNGQVVSRPPYSAMYWSPAQMLAHQTVNGAPSRTGDLFASGTVSGPEKEQRGAFIELTWGGKEPVMVDGRPRTFLEDGDEVVLTATAPGAGGTRIGFGEARGRITGGKREER